MTQGGLSWKPPLALNNRSTQPIYIWIFTNEKYKIGWYLKFLLVTQGGVPWKPPLASSYGVNRRWKLWSDEIIINTKIYIFITIAIVITIIIVIVIIAVMKARIELELESRILSKILILWCLSLNLICSKENIVEWDKNHIMDELIWVMSWLYLCERKIVTAQMKQSKCKPRLSCIWNSTPVMNSLTLAPV